MARRNDGTARRYEFQIFDDEQGRAIARHLDDVQASGGSVAAFIRDALLFYIEQGSQPQSQPQPPDPRLLQREINALWAAVSQPAPRAVHKTDHAEPEPMMASSGIDLSSRRRPRLKPGRAQPPPTLPEQAIFDSSLAARQLVQSIHAYNQPEVYRG